MARSHRRHTGWGWPLPVQRMEKVRRKVERLGTGMVELILLLGTEDPYLMSHGQVADKGLKWPDRSKSLEHRQSGKTDVLQCQR